MEFDLLGDWRRTDTQREGNEALLGGAGLLLCDEYFVEYRLGGGGNTGWRGGMGRDANLATGGFIRARMVV
jgi:hypothetical protein